MRREIKLDGGEISVLKTIGFSGTAIPGKLLLERSDEMETAEFIETLNSLLSSGYVVSNKVDVRSLEDIERAFFRVSPAYSRDLRGSINPGRKRDETRTRRQRRR